MVYGHTEPRIYTPPLRELTPETSLGFSVIDFANEVLGTPLYPWQEWLVIHALEIVGDLSSKWSFRFRYVIVEVARQNGKTFLSEVIALWWLYMFGAPLVIGTAQSLDIAEEVWEGAVGLAEDNPDLAGEILQVKRTNGKKELRLTDNRRYKIAAASRKGGRGLSGDLVLMDELREHQNWEAWAAVTKTTLARPNAIVWCMSNAGDATSVVLRHLRLNAHKLLGDPDGAARALGMLGDPDDEVTPIEETDIGLFEWSAPPKCDIYNEEGWAYANPSMNIGGITSRAIRASAQADDEDKFRTECLCQWIEAAIDPPFPVGAWEAGKDENSYIAQDSELYWGVDISEDRTHAAISVCGLRPDRKWHVEVAEYRPGTAWLVDWFKDGERQAKYGGFYVSLQENGAPVSAYADTLGAIDNVEIVPCGGKNLAAWCGRFYDAVAASNGSNDSDATPVFHIAQAALDLAANIAATKALGDGAWAFNRKNSAADISPLVACAMAYGQATDIEKPKKQSVYEEYDPLL